MFHSWVVRGLSAAIPCCSRCSTAGLCEVLAQRDLVLKDKYVLRTTRSTRTLALAYIKFLLAFQKQFLKNSCSYFFRSVFLSAMILSLFEDAEEWRPIKEFPHYLVSNVGRVKLARTGEIKVQKREVTRRANGTVSSQYKVVILSDHKGQQGKNYRRLVHRLVALSFLGDPPSPEHTVDHVDTDTTNNVLTNLRWASLAEQKQNKRTNNAWPIATENLPHSQRLRIEKENNC